MSRARVLRGLLLVAIAAGIALGIVFRASFAPERIEAWVGALGLWAPLVYIGIYLIAPSLFIPGAAITLAGGALFGPLWGVLYVLIGSVGGATLAFLIARYLAGDWVERRSRGLLRQVKHGVEAEGWRFVAFVRLVPLFPFSVLNYALGLTRIPLLTYVVASAVCMLPGIAGYVYLGYAGREALLGGEHLPRKIGIALAVFAALVFLPFLVRRLRGARAAASPLDGGAAQRPVTSGPQRPGRGADR
jgi:uncharacterized membrane protein YdjX (TVP38/TMEM64 family)